MQTPSSAPAFKNSHKSQLRGRSAGILWLTLENWLCPSSRPWTSASRLGELIQQLGEGSAVLPRDYRIAGEEMGPRL